VSLGGIRVTWRDLPGRPAPCPIERPCVYRREGVCDDAQINKRNSDSACHHMSNKDVLARLRPRR
jgi:hypothetical protein